MAHLPRGARRRSRGARARRRARTCRRRARRRSRRGGRARRRPAREPGHVGQHAAGRAIAEDQPAWPRPRRPSRRGSAARRRPPRTTRPRARIRRARPRARARASATRRRSSSARIAQHRIAVGQRVADLRRCRRRGSASRTRAAAAGRPCGRSPRPSAGPPATGAARTPSARSAASPSSCWRRSGEALARNHGPSAPRIGDRRLRPGPRGGSRAGRLARRAAAVPLREAAAGGGAEDPNAHRAMIETGDDLRGHAHADRLLGSMKVELTTASPAEVEADVLALAAGGLRRAPSSTRASTGGWCARRRTRIRSRWCRSARELRARRVALVAIDGLDPEDLRTAAARVVRAHRGVGTIAWALDDTLPMAAVPPGAGDRRGRGPRRLRRGPLEERRARHADRRALRRLRRRRGPRGDRRPRRGRRALDERRPRARRRAAERRHARRPRRARGARCPACASRCSIRSPPACPRSRPWAARARSRRGSSSCATSRPGAPERPRLALVGKAVTFDAGGYFLKPQSDIVRQKGDMGGGAAVLAALGAIAELELPLSVVGVLAGLREHDRPRRDPAVGRDHDRRRPHGRGDEPGRRGPADPRRRALVRAPRRARRTSSTSPR